MEGILIAGCGAIGSMFGAFLRGAGHDVTLLGRDWHLEAVRHAGLRVDGIWGDHYADGFRVATRVADIAGQHFDAILICAKSYDTGAVVAEVAPLLKDDGVVMSMQNGLGNVETIADRVGEDHTIGASVLIGAQIPEPGRVTVTVQAAPVVLGPLVPTPLRMGVARRWAAHIHAAGVSCEPTNDILAVLWAKVLYNAALNPLGAMLQVHYGALGEDADLRAIMDAVIDEVFAVARGRGVRLPWNSADDYRVRFYGQLLPDTVAHRSSMLQDLERGRRTEIQSINGQVCRYGAELGLPTPYNELLTRLVSWRERQPITDLGTLHQGDVRTSLT